MKIRTRVRAGGIKPNHNTTLAVASSNGQGCTHGRVTRWTASSR